MNLDLICAEADARIQSRIDQRVDYLHALFAAQFAFARRSFGQRTRVKRVDPNKWAFYNGLESA